MALKSWHRAALTAAGMALALAVILPPRPYPEPGEPLLGALYPVEYWWWGRDYRNTLDVTVSDLQNRHRAAVMADSLFALTSGPRAVKSADGALTVLYEPPLSADSARVWLGMLERELALVPRGSGAGMPVVVALKSAPPKRNPRGAEGEAVARDGAARMDPWIAMRFVSPRAERPGCFVALRLGLSPGDIVRLGEIVGRDARTGVSRTAVLDWCLIYARFGVPGARVERWAGSRVDVRRWWTSGENLSWALEAARKGRQRDEQMSTLSPRELSDYWADPLNSSCVRGSSVLCLKSVGLTADPTLRGYSYWIAKVRRSLLAALMLKDPARFEKFWRSAEPAAVALEKAYGRPAGEVVGEWKRTIFKPPALGPRTPALLSSLGWAVLAIGLSLLTAHRRQVSS